MGKLQQLLLLVATLTFGILASADTVVGTASWSIQDLRDGAGDEVFWMFLDYRYDTNRVSIPVNGVLVTQTGESTVYGTAFLRSDGGLSINLGQLHYSINFETDAGFNGIVKLYGADGSLLSQGTAQFIL